MAKQLTDIQKQKIVADYVNVGNYCEVARMNDVSEASVRNVIKGFDKEELTRLCEQKRKENTQSTIEYMQTQHETKKRILDKILKAIETKAEDVDMFTNIKDLATAYGIILDKELKVLELQQDKNKMDDQLTKLDELLGEIRKDANS